MRPSVTLTASPGTSTEPGAGCCSITKPDPLNFAIMPMRPIWGFAS